MIEFLAGTVVAAAGTKAAEYFFDWLKAKGAQGKVLKIIQGRDVAEWNWSGEKLLEKLIELDYRLIENLTDEREGTIEQWAPVFMNRPEGWAVLAGQDKKIAGYYSFFALQDVAFAKAKEGKLLDCEVTMDNTVEMDVPGFYKAYIALLGAMPDVPGAGTKLIEAFFDQLEYLAERGIFVEEFVANAFTPVGERICKGFMNFGRDHEDFGRIYMLRMWPWPSGLCHKRRENLRGLYEEAFSEREEREEAVS